jgi:pilus assembly protein Flp/PilA
LERRRKMKASLRAAGDSLRCDEGTTAVEYAVMLALIIVVCIGTITSLGLFVDASYGKVDVTLR